VFETFSKLVEPTYSSLFLFGPAFLAQQQQIAAQHPAQAAQRLAAAQPAHRRRQPALLLFRVAVNDRRGSPVIFFPAPVSRPDSAESTRRRPSPTPARVRCMARTPRGSPSLFKSRRTPRDPHPNPSRRLLLRRAPPEP
jgi:hypothetical protein